MHRGVVALVLPLAVGAAIARPSVAIVAAASNTANPNTNTRFTDVRDKLVATGKFESVGIISTTRFQDGALLTLADLEPYDGVIVWSNDSHEDSAGLGTLLADYVDSGGGVVHAVFGNTSTNPDRQLLGRWADDGYGLIPYGSNWRGATFPQNIGDRLIDGHPILRDVATFRAFAEFIPGIGPWGAFRPQTNSINPGAYKLATWEDGATLVVLSESTSRVVELGMHPVSSAVNAQGYWDQATDGDNLMANALLWTIFGPADWNVDGEVDFFDASGFLGDFQDQVEAADLNLDGVFDFFDVTVFLNAFQDAGD